MKKKLLLKVYSKSGRLMKVLGLISGGKDSIFNLMNCVVRGHELVCLAHIQPSEEELDSYMYQSVGHSVVPYVAECLGLPLYQKKLTGSPVNIEMDYNDPISKDEVEDLFELLRDIKTKHHPEIEAISVGAILSNYQKVRVEHIANRLSLKVLAYLWNQDQETLVKKMIHCEIHAIIIKVASLGLNESHLCKDLQSLLPFFISLNEKWGMNIAGEGGEYESLVLDCPLYKKKIHIEKYKVVQHSESVFYMIPEKLSLVEKATITNDDNWKTSLLELKSPSS